MNTTIVSNETLFLKKGQNTFGLINFITQLMQRDHIEKALELINIYFGQLSFSEKTMLTENIIQATNQYEIPSEMLSEEYYDFIVSQESDNIFFG